jgi:diguanylate cyclase (GGDEF)-like protein
LRPQRALLSFVALVSTAGFALVAVILVRAGDELLDRLDARLALFAAAILVAELYPLDIPGRQAQLTFSTAFAFALLLADGTEAVVVTSVVCVLVADLVRRRQLRKIVFNAGQYALSWGAAGAVLALTTPDLPDRGGLQYLDAENAPAVVAAAVTFLLVNTALASTPPALAAGARPIVYIRSDFSFQVWTTVVLIALAPVVVIVADYDLWLIPLLWIPLVAIQRGSRQAVLNQYRALHDTLTGLPNRAQLHARLGDALDRPRAQREGTVVGVLLMDLDGFKEINDTFGHRHGDLLLRQVAARLRAQTRAGDLVTRLGGDEFAVLLASARSEDECVTVAERVLGGLEGPMEVQEVEVDVRASVGIAVSAGGGHGIEELLSRADVAMYHAKETGKGWALYSEELNVHTPERLALVADLRRALERRELVLHYQPKIELETGALEGVEALVRWRHPERGLMEPTDFVGLAEHTGMIRPLTLWVLREALRQSAAWRAEGFAVPLAVNLSVRALTHELPSEIEALLAERSATPDWLELEVTESTVMQNPVEALAVLDALSRLGISLSVDDFGTGHSSLRYLRRLPVRELKIDRSFVTDMDLDQSDHAIVRSTIDLARHLDLVVVAEGVESATVLEELRRLGCRFGQGFHISPPLSPDAMLAWARGTPGQPAPGERFKRSPGPKIR